MCLHLSVLCGGPMSFGHMFGYICLGLSIDSASWILTSSCTAYSAWLVGFSQVCLLVCGISVRCS